MSKKQFKTEVSDLLNLIIHSLYSNKEIFLRELISNSSDAIDKLKYLSLVDGSLKGFSFDPCINITFDSNAKTLTISDNGIGMDEKDLNDNLGTIASSGTKKFLATLTEEAKKDSNLIGQFGVGFYSAFMVASSVEVISKKAGSNEAFRWYSEGKSSYSIDPAERAEQGSTIILHLNEEGEEYANRYRLDSLIKKYSDHVAYPIYLEYDQESYTEEKDSEGNPIKKSEHKREQVNSASALWTRNKSSIKDEEYKEFYKNNYFDQEDPLFYLHTHAEGATEYTTLFYIPAKAPFDMNYADYRSGVKLYVKRVYITDDDKQLLPTYLRFVRGVIDSEDLPLNVSREILQENKIMSAIRNGSVKKLLSEFKKISENNPELYDKFIKEYNRPLKEGLYSDYANRDSLLELVRYKSDSVDGFTSFKAYKERMKEGQKAIYYITGGKENILRNSPLLAAYKKKGYEVLIMDDDIDEIVISMVGEYKELPLKAINKSGALDDVKEEKSEEEKKSSESIVKRFKDLLGDSVKDVIASSRLVDTPAVIVMDENDPSWQMQKLMKQMGNVDDMPEVKPIFEINTESKLVKQVETLSDDDAKMLANVLLDSAYLAEGIMVKDPAAYTKNVASLLAK
ncbi:molecular chaperone HtpG [Bullifex porci]|uniref:molecular chaperone HtpG n=1 Tax=Bullifex porci TaxID=2606638 RepID=UPI0023F16E9E|nr:molecular chaperone HtpG [Bullifex porci]MDD7255569.1 molecular chaperone HtpG [Bullifex porci]MDY2740311.1 molecular chaperone HtpG [Bullifex porci]